MKDLKKGDIIAVLCCLCAVIPGAAVYGELPERIVTSWSITNAPSGTSSKAFTVFAFPLIFSAMTFILLLYARKLEKKGRMAKLPDVIRVAFPAMFIVFQGIILLSALGRMSDIRFPVCLVASAMLIVLGNYMPKVRKNWLFGIRTPHTLMNEDVWYRTHRFAGVIMTICGIVSAVTTLTALFVTTYIILTLSVVIPAVYGEVIYYIGKKSSGKAEE